MEFAEKAMKIWQDNYPELKDLYVDWIGENNTYVVVSLSTPHIDETCDGFECPMYVLDKRTGYETYDYSAGLLCDEELADLNFDDLSLFPQNESSAGV